MIQFVSIVMRCVLLKITAFLCVYPCTIHLLLLFLMMILIYRSLCFFNNSFDIYNYTRIYFVNVSYYEIYILVGCSKKMIHFEMIFFTGKLNPVPDLNRIELIGLVNLSRANFGCDKKRMLVAATKFRF